MSDPDNKPSEHAVILQFLYGKTDLSEMFAFEDQLRSAVEAAVAGEVDGHDIATDGSHGLFYLYGPNADTLYSAIGDTLRQAVGIRVTSVKLRYGSVFDPDAKEVTHQFDPN